MAYKGEDGVLRCNWTRGHPLLKSYHDDEYGVALHKDAELLERLALEIMQAGLSWLTVLKKREGLRHAFRDFDIDLVAAFDGSDIERLLNDSGIIRNRLKIRSIIHNAEVFQALSSEHGSVKAWLDSRGRLSKTEWVRLFKRTFRFTGGEITGEFLMSCGYLPIPHDEGCYKNPK